MTPRSSCCGWPSATSRTNEPEPAPRRKACHPASAAPPPDSSKEPSSKAGDKPSARWPWPTPTASTPTSPDPGGLGDQAPPPPRPPRLRRLPRHPHRRRPRRDERPPDHQPQRRLLTQHHNPQEI